jgi:hypothetical protein
MAGAFTAGRARSGEVRAAGCSTRVGGLSWRKQMDPTLPPDEEFGCDWCGSPPDVPHSPKCPEYQPTFDDLSFCPSCGCSYLTTCEICDGGDDE